MRDRGFSLVEALVVLAIVLAMAAVAIPPFRAHFVEAHLVGASQQEWYARPTVVLSLWPISRVQ